MTFGLINLHKPAGISSRQAIDPLARQLRPTKVGHAGTLDPLASGVLVVTVGHATRLTSFVQEWPKTYHGTFLLGRSSDTEDIEGTVLEETSPRRPTREELEQAARDLTGLIQQRPPAYSALKVQGRRAYDLARSGATVDLAPRAITIHELEVVAYDYPTLELHIRCSSGTYVRSLGRDLAIAVGTSAVMSQLTRTAIGHLTLEHAVSLETLLAGDPAQHVLPAGEAVRGLPRLVLDDETTRRIARGQFIEVPDELLAANRSHADRDAETVAAFLPDGNLAALLVRKRGRLFGPERNFIAAN